MAARQQFQHPIPHLTVEVRPLDGTLPGTCIPVVERIKGPADLLGIGRKVMLVSMLIPKVKVDLTPIEHVFPDDGLHFLPSGYSNIATTVFQGIISGLGAE